MSTPSPPPETNLDENSDMWLILFQNRESLQYVLESVPIVDRAFVHCDYASYNLPTHMEQQAG